MKNLLALLLTLCMSCTALEPIVSADIALVTAARDSYVSAQKAVLDKYEAGRLTLDEFRDELSKNNVVFKESIEVIKNGIVARGRAIGEALPAAKDSAVALLISATMRAALNTAAD